MLWVRTEYKRGVLFVRLDGRIDNEGYINKINWLIDKIGIKYTVINLTNINNISITNIDHIYKHIQNQKRKQRLLIICDENNLRNVLFKKEIPKITREQDAFSIIL